MYTYIHIYIYIYTFTYVLLFVCPCVCVCVYVTVCVCMLLCVLTNIAEPCFNLHFWFSFPSAAGISTAGCQKERTFF